MLRNNTFRGRVELWRATVTPKIFFALQESVFTLLGTILTMLKMSYIFKPQSLANNNWVKGLTGHLTCFGVPPPLPWGRKTNQQLKAWLQSRDLKNGVGQETTKMLDREADVDRWEKDRETNKKNCKISGKPIFQKQ